MSERERTRGGVNDTILELEFTLGVVLGVGLFAVGFAFAILTFSIDTAPPAPYLQSFTDRLVLGGFSLSMLIVGVGLVRWAGMQVGW